MQLLLPLLTLLLITPHVPSTTNNGTHLTPADLHNIQPTRKGVAKQNGTYHRSRIKRFKIIDWMFKKSSTTAQPPLRDPPTPPWAPPQGPPARTWEPPWAQPTPPWQSSHGPPTRPWEPPWTQPTPPREPPWGPPTPPWTQPSDPPHITTETTTPTTTTTTRPPATAETVKVTTTMAKTKTRASSSTKRKRTSSLVVGDLSPLPSTQGVSAQPDSTEGTEEFHDPEFIGVHVLQYTKRFRDGKRKREEESSTGLIVGIVAAVIILIIIVAVATIFLLVARKKKAQKNAQKRVALAKKPRKMESANINATKFTHGGALVLDPKLRGPVVHACSSQEKISIHSIQFDPHLNEIVDIGSDVEIMKENADTTTLGTEVGTKVGKTILSIRRAIDRRKPVAAKTPGGMAAKTPGGGASPMSPQGAPQGTPQGTANRTPGKLTSKRHALKQAAPKRKRATPQNE